MKKLLPIVILLLFLVGGGGSAWCFLLRGDAPAAAEVEAPASDPAFVTLDTMAVPVIRADGSIRTFIIELALEVPNGEAAVSVTDMLPKIKDRLMVTLHELLARQFIIDSGYDQVMIKQHLLRTARKAAGEDQITAVLIKNLEEFRRG
jgi:flagellar basal body-associated protein FliL